ncbi:hypothetical protein AB0J81_09400 [Streptomyces bobili]|uniref:hypothetical protein n=1 Tax=Streptomyces bobili TaxID=67280 RepID=UPI003421A998
MNAREDILAGLRQVDDGTVGDLTPEALVDAYRTEVIVKAVGRLKAIPVTCTSLTGPVWYGDGWNSAITVLEEIADYQTPDDEAYPGELQMLRALALGIQVAARKADMDRVQYLALDHAARDGDARDKAKPVSADDAVRDAFAAGRESAGADGFKLDGFRTVWTHSDGSDRPVSELRCQCGGLLQLPRSASLLDLLIAATRHECGGRS